ncbi:Arylsulfatase [Pirellulimonas nuda]|uniref:Arylsulfatase n=1 Tax=Pirellulimonas nuda TaxID=2528009 RepID=A0A518DAL0_9BACT|nr:sulfatase-like hydrolase/transferase [Pirellulimonas nuda]QDU88521.1 Arylsulfatase [Pirellulimonas nuda]
MILSNRRHAYLAARRSIAACLGLAVCGVLAERSPAATAEPSSGHPPNIVLIVADDLGFNQIGAYGDTPIRTPNLDRLAAAGVRFTQAYAGGPVCSPSRVSLFTGRDGRLMGDCSNGVQLQELDVTIPMVLKLAGYDTALFGKYSIGGQMGITDPLAKGFDTWFGMYSILEGHRQYPTFLWRDGVKQRIVENEAGRRGVYAQEKFTDEAIDYINQQHAAPFFAMLCYSSPHAELAVPQQYSRPYESEMPAAPYLGTHAKTGQDRYARYYPDAVAHPHATLAGMVTALDDYVGRIMAALQAKGVADNTLMIFTSDNGPHEEGGASPEYFRAAAPYRGIKRDLYDGGIHVPMICSWPARITKGRVDDTPWAFADMLPTLADVAGVQLEDVPRLSTNGVSIKGLLGDRPRPPTERTLYWEFSEQVGDPNSGVLGKTYQAARRNQWKAVRYGRDASTELYDVIADPGETHDLAAAEPALHQEFLQLFEEN